ncbi:hypothetical protein [Spirosoma arboris]|nr:hypothetical protein [Spirosoma arboris]
MSILAYSIGYFRGIHVTRKDYHRFLDEKDNWLRRNGMDAKGD